MKNNIPRYNRSNNPRKGDPGYPGILESQERDPDGNPIADATAAFGDMFYPADAYVIEGGGLIEPSLDDTITVNRVDEHDNNDDWKTERQHADLPHDEEYGYAGLGYKRLPTTPYTADDLINALNEYAASSYKGARLVRDVATAAVFNTSNITGTDALPLLGSDWSRKRAIVKSLAGNTATTEITATGGAGGTASASLPLGVRLVSFQVDMATVAAPVSGVVTLTNSVAGPQSYEITDGPNGGFVGDRFVPALAPVTGAQITVTVPVIVGGGAFTITLIGETDLTVLLGNQNVLSNVVGAGTFSLEPGQSLEVQNTDSLFAVLATGAPVGAIAVVSVLNESYER